MNASLMLISYIDPVSGVILLQLIIGGGLGCGVRFHRKIWSFCTRLFSKRENEMETVPVTAHISMYEVENIPLEVSHQPEYHEYRKAA
jgi:hypothetical protein